MYDEYFVARDILRKHTGPIGPIYIFTARTRSLQKVYVFSRVCLSVRLGGGVPM